MKHKLPEEVMPELYLTREEGLSVEKEANDMLRDALASYRAFVAANRVLPREKWKRVKSKEGFDVFRSRSKSAAVGKSDRSASESSSSFSQLRSSQASSSSGSSGTPASTPEIERSNPSDSSGSMTASQVSSTATSATAAMAQFPKVVLTGFAPGTIEDAAFGVIASTEAIWRLRSTYLHDHHRDCKILATLKRPCKDDPFRFLGIKWAARKLPSFVQQRDMVYLENIGVVYDAEGKIEMVYNLMHSIELPGIPELSQYDILRMKLSLCYIMRPYDDKSIEYYCRAFSIPSGDVPSSIAVMIYADALLSTINLIDCSHMKKLMWLTQQQRKLRVQNDATATTTSQDTDTVTHCQGCLRGLKLFGGLNRPVSRCQCCKRIVCGKCSSERKLVLDIADDGAVTQKPLAFCVQCVIEARALPAVKIAVATAISCAEEDCANAWLSWRVAGVDTPAFDKIMASAAGGIGERERLLRHGAVVGDVEHELHLDAVFAADDALAAPVRRGGSQEAAEPLEALGAQVAVDRGLHGLGRVQHGLEALLLREPHELLRHRVGHQRPGDRADHVASRSSEAAAEELDPALIVLARDETERELDADDVELAQLRDARDLDRVQQAVVGGDLAGTRAADHVGALDKKQVALRREEREFLGRPLDAEEAEWVVWRRPLQRREDLAVVALVVDERATQLPEHLHVGEVSQRQVLHCARVEDRGDHNQRAARLTGFKH